MASLITKITAFIGFIALPQVLGYASAYHIRKFAPKYYPTLKTPWWTPPTALLKPIWKIMYLLMGIASYLVWRQKLINGISVKVPLALYAIQLFFNILWAPLFFRIQSPILALYCILLNLLSATLATLTFSIPSPNAAKLMLPYVGFLFINGYLNKCIWRLNQKKVKQIKKSKRSKRVVVSDSSSDSESD
ncbi:hypothetical protein DSO57_1033803 [Entomophthora muscae]|uniref:Uncharacterized protein n=1 Tax=Entomophthora muscae TaxID=34485 RepID=A0ACC2TME4_9FUNG|nr:hypothetical protein DSO57_1033803 [Entomophthora muscae]